jgi:two-component system, NtrC family, sensor histidine kinase HydH
MNEAQFESTKHYVGFDERSAAALAAFHPLAQPHMQAIIDDFYGAIERHADARSAITGGRQQIERLKLTLVAWLETVLAGPHDAALLESHSRIGRVHVRIALPQEFMLTAMNRIRVRLFDVAQQEFAGDPARLRSTVIAVDQILDLELAIMLDTYREDLAEKIRASERLATIGQLAASIGHELRNPLGIIESSLFLMRQRLDKLGFVDPLVEKHRDKIVRQVKQCGQIITNLLDLARDRPPRRRRISLLPLVELAIENAGLPKEMALELELPPGLSIDADPDDLGHVIMNLASNAAQAQKGTGTIHLSAERYKGGTAFYVRDEGPGVPADIRHRIFDALFTTKARGTGLGLALSRRIVQAHGGELGLVPSERGAAFRVWIPDLESAETARGVAELGGKE